jgi:hypothetical protein
MPLAHRILPTIAPMHRIAVVGFALLAAIGGYLGAGGLARSADAVPRPLLARNQAVDWWFVFKFNSSNTFAGCGPSSGTRSCMFGGDVQTRDSFGQQFAFASNNGEALQQGTGCVGATASDPVGATFDQVYNGSFFYVIWNDQFYGDPKVCGKSANCDAPWGHSKGMLAWNDAGEGLVMQVSTPSWPGSGTSRIQRKAGNTLGCIKTNNNLRASQHFFALKLNKDDLVKMLKALKTASVATDPTNLQVVHNGGPQDIRDLVNALGKTPNKDAKSPTREELSTHVTLITKPSKLNVPPWQMVSALLDGIPERAATWWTKPWIYTTTKSSKVSCWSPELRAKPGPVAIALTGEWKGKQIKLAAPSNHAKIGIADSGNERYVIFGDLNQQGALTPPDCGASQNGRGGMFFVLKNKALYDGIHDLIDGETAKTKASNN